jgi:hypothetical protein
MCLLTNVFKKTSVYYMQLTLNCRIMLR